MVRHPAGSAGPPNSSTQPRWTTHDRPMTDSKQQRINMVESQVRPSDVTDRRIIRAMLEVPREVFVPRSLQALAYMDEAVPAAEPAGGRSGRFLLAPRTFAKLVQLAEIGPDAVVLDVGCATGYSTAVLARLAKAVVAVEAEDCAVPLAGVVVDALGVLDEAGAVPVGGVDVLVAGASGAAATAIGTARLNSSEISTAHAVTRPSRVSPS